MEEQEMPIKYFHWGNTSSSRLEDNSSFHVIWELEYTLLEKKLSLQICLQQILSWVEEASGWQGKNLQLPVKVSMTNDICFQRKLSQEYPLCAGVS